MSQDREGIGYEISKVLSELDGNIENMNLILAFGIERFVSQVFDKR